MNRKYWNMALALVTITGLMSATAHAGARPLKPKAKADVIKSAVYDKEREVMVVSGDVYHGCRLTMPDGGSFLVSLSVRSTYDVTLKNGVLSHRAGCQFINLPASIESEIQRYIFQLERNRRFHT